MTIRDTRGNRMDNARLGVPAYEDDQLSGSADRILHLLAVDSHVTVTLTTEEGVTVIDPIGKELSIGDGVAHVHSTESLRDDVIQEVTDRLAGLAVTGGLKRAEV